MNQKRVAIQGTLASFHEEAAHKYFGEDIEIVECITFRQTFEAVKQGKADYVVMAIENSIAGSLLPNYTLLEDYNFSINGEVYLHIQLHLVALPGVGFEDLKQVHSHPIAIRQCTNFFEDYPQLDVIEKADTASCAKNIREKGLTDTAAIANFAAAKRYELNILERRIETNKKNFTRFLVLAKQAEESTTNNKASIVFQVGNAMGTLAGVLNVLVENQINLTKIQSMPIVGRPDDFRFYADVEWERESDYDHCMTKLLKKVVNLAVLGEYRRNPLK